MNFLLTLYKLYNINNSLMVMVMVFQGTSVSEGLMPEEFYIVRNKGLRSLELYEE